MSKRLDAIEERLDKLESVLSKLGAWIAKKQEQEAQANFEQDPVVTRPNEDGEPWLINKLCPSCQMATLTRRYSLLGSVKTCQYVCKQCGYESEKTTNARVY